MTKADEMWARAVELMLSRKGMNTYTNGGNRKYFFGKPDNAPGNTTQKGYSDCSSAVRKAIQAVSGIDIGSNTNRQIQNRENGLIVDETDGFMPDESRLLPGDCLYFKGNASHTLNVGHVEMYAGNGMILGHGSGTGPKERSLESYCRSRASNEKRYFMAIRWITDDADTSGLKSGDQGESVRLLQLALILLGFSPGTYGADGDFGPATKAAVMAFQESEGLPATGIADDITMAALKERSAKAELQNPSSPDSLTIKPGTWNVRRGPGTIWPVAGVVRGGEKLERAQLNGWNAVIFNGEVCFIAPSATEMDISTSQ